MKLSNFAFVFLAACAAAKGDWKLEGGGAYADDVKRAIINSIDIATEAVKVLNGKYNDERVQSMIKHIYGQTGFTDKLKQGKAMLEGVSQYKKVPSPFFGQWGNAENTDVFFQFDTTNYSPNAQGMIISKHPYRLIPPADYQDIQYCHDKTAKAGDRDEMPMAITINSNGVDEPALKAGSNAGGSQDPRDYPVQRTDKANTIDLCDWYLREIAGSRMVEVNDASIARVQEQSFIDGQKPHEKPIDGLTQSLAGTILHEFTHTNLGGLSRDEPAGDCYGWTCVGNIHNGRNADSATHLGVAMYLYSKSFWVDGGRVRPI